MKYIVTIARRFGSGDGQIAHELSAMLGIPVYDQQILKMAAEHSGLSESLFAKADERLGSNFLRNRLERFMFSSRLEPSDRYFFSDVNLYHIQVEIIKLLSKSVSCIILGKAANYILRDLPNVASFFVCAPRPCCIKAVMDEMKVDEREAKRMIKKTDKYRSDYYRFYTNGGTWDDPTAYDMIINTDKVGRDKCAALIADCLLRKFGKGFNDD